MKTDIYIISGDVIFRRMLELELSAAGYTVAFGTVMPMNDGELDCVICVAELDGYAEYYPRIRLGNERLIVISDEAFGNYTVFARPFYMRDFIAAVDEKYGCYTMEAADKVKNTGIAVTDELIIDENLRTASFRDEAISLTGREFDLLLYLYQRRGIPVSRAEAVCNVWKYNFAGDTNIVDVYIRYLREKIDEKYNVKLIYTVRNKGYMIK